MIAAGILFSPVFVAFVTWFMGWSRLRRFCAPGGNCPGH
jgi:hypothetical protein